MDKRTREISEIDKLINLQVKLPLGGTGKELMLASFLKFEQKFLSETGDGPVIRIRRSLFENVRGAPYDDNGEILKDNLTPRSGAAGTCSTGYFGRLGFLSGTNASVDLSQIQGFA